mmetsp:Transcript_6833/g.12301  ORF Transcript_6833/g.12301 Transcript_6833/m.12301 type:complete len:489 (-) Transcript_6833:313-1779(-)|eukprot:CAMPEP_0184700994 /NCGR_PEP_ID=MMETSP0313-20130426/17497_1 /TAXON_ID=2792 /ORGANISM="Porphyridium aerugineum, Strain SAG 1380-2" /LENGTH=488 /DNA_ID=CAMNT_0027160897 /DNA_START=190 /DNA_END=1656 /DNA_ORIENTATION=+
MTSVHYTRPLEITVFGPTGVWSSLWMYRGMEAAGTRYARYARMIGMRHYARYKASGSELNSLRRAVTKSTEYNKPGLFGKLNHHQQQQQIGTATNNYPNLLLYRYRHYSSLGNHSIQNIATNRFRQGQTPRQGLGPGLISPKPTSVSSRSLHQYSRLSPNTQLPPHDAAAAAQHSYLPYVTYHDLEQLLHKTGYGGYPIYQLLLGILIFGSALLWLFWGKIKLWGAKETADVASRTLEDEALQKKAEDLAKQVTNALLMDEKTYVAMQELLIQVLQDPVSAEIAKAFVYDMLVRLMEDEQFKKKTAVFVADILHWDVVRVATRDLAGWVLTTDYVLEQGYSYVGKVLQHEYSREQGKEYLTWAAIESLKSDETRLWAIKLASEVLNDRVTQERAGEAIWSATKHGLAYGFWMRGQTDKASTLAKDTEIHGNVDKQKDTVVVDSAGVSVDDSVPPKTEPDSSGASSSSHSGKSPPSSPRSGTKMMDSTM